MSRPTRATIPNRKRRRSHNHLLASTPCIAFLFLSLQLSIAAFPVCPHRKSVRIRKYDTSSIYKPISRFGTRDERCQRNKSLCLLPQEDSADETEQDQQYLLRSSTAFLLGAAVVVVAPLLLLHFPATADAIDHPVDFSSLHIPNPIPDADPRYFISGGICAAASHGVTTPIDVIKTKMQSEPAVFTNNNNNRGGGGGGILSAASTIIQTDGVTSLLNGLGPTIVGYGMEGALKFGMYESLKPTFVTLLSSSPLSSISSSDPTTEAYLAASVAAGAIASILLCPMEQTRIRLVTDKNFAAKYGFLDGFARLVKEEGIGTVFYGLPAMLSKQVPYTMAKQVSFDLFSSFLYATAIQYSISQAQIKTEVEILAAFLASFLACLASHPGDVVLTKTYKTFSSQGFLGTVQELYKDNGVNAFFSGISARFVHVGAIITSQLVLYDVIKQLLGLPATGT